MIKSLAKYRDILFYVLTLLIFGGFIYLVIIKGKSKESSGLITTAHSAGSALQDFGRTSLTNLSHPLAILLLQIITIILVARIFGFICKKIKQPTVIGEIIAGIFLGPSFLGIFFPEYSSFLFPASALSNLQFLSQIGLIFFMFVVGMELDVKVLRNKAKDAVIISHASIVFPFSLGIILAYFIYSEFAPVNVSFLSFSLFIGISMSITAFPVLARIVQEKGLSKTKIGTIAITCAAADDITAWCLLAAVIAIVKAGSMASALYIIVLAVAYVFFMLSLVRPFLKRIGDKYSNREGLSKPVVAVFFITLMISSYITEVIGIHALFGAFMAGVIMPSNVKFRNLFIEKIEDVSLVLLLPLFFVFTGLRTQIGLLNEGHLWITCFTIVGVAVAGKFIGSATAAKLVGQSWRESLMIGALMNTRGLMELVVLNIGYDLGVLSPEIFAMMVIMALLTTFMTAPALTLINRVFRGNMPTSLVPSMPRNDMFNVLVSFGSPEKGVSLVRLANSFVRGAETTSSVTAMHLSPSNEINQYNFIEYEKESFRPIRIESKKLKLPVSLYFKPSQDIEGEIAETANQGNFNLLLLGIGRSIFEGTALGKLIGTTSKLLNPSRVYEAITGREKLFARSLFDEKVKYVMRASHIPVGILVDHGIEKVEKVLLLLIDQKDGSAIPYAQRQLQNGPVTVHIMDIGAGIKEHRDLQEKVGGLFSAFPNHVKILENEKIGKDFLKQFDLMILSHDGWKKLISARYRWITHTPSVLIIKE